MVKKSSELLWLFGIIFVALGVAICSKADLGISMIAAPAFIVSEAISSTWSGFSVGVTEYLMQALLLIIMCIVIRRFKLRFLLAFAVAVIYGYTLDLFLWILRDINPDTVLMRWVTLIIGDIVCGFGVACYFKTYMPLQVYELFVAEISSGFKIGITKVKTCFDYFFLFLSLVLVFLLFNDASEFDWSSIYYSSFHSIGLGTLFTTVVNSPIIALMGKLIDKLFDPTPRFEGLRSALKTE